MSGKKLTIADKNWLRQYYSTASWDEILKRFPGRSKRAITHAAHRLKVKRRPNGGPQSKYSAKDVQAAIRFGLEWHLPYMDARHRINHELRHLDKEKRKHLIDYYGSEWLRRRSSRQSARVATITANAAYAQVLQGVRAA